MSLAAGVVRCAAAAAGAAEARPAAAAPKTALVTGGTRGIGLGIARCLARDGHNLVLGYNSNKEAAEATKRQLEESYGVAVECVGGDISLAGTMDALFACVAERFDNCLDAFVHNAGLYVGITSSSDAQPDVQDTEEVFKYYHAVYVLAFKRGLEKALKCDGLKHVVAISSPGCNTNQTPKIQYEAPGQGKAGLEFLVRLHALKLAPQGINVNCLIPGFTKTEAWSHLPSPPEALDAMVKNTPAQRWAQPEEVGEVAAFLCSPRSAFVTGVAIPVDGGLHLR